jgi:hypothetical protein
MRGNERLAWDQMAASAAEAASIRPVIYIDSELADMQDVSCGTKATAAGFTCSGRLPPLSPGRHIIQLASVAAGQSESQQSTLSDPLLVDVASPTTDAAKP